MSIEDKRFLEIAGEPVQHDGHQSEATFSGKPMSACQTAEQSLEKENKQIGRKMLPSLMISLRTIMQRGGPSWGGKKTLAGRTNSHQKIFGTYHTMGHSSQK